MIFCLDTVSRSISDCQRGKVISKMVGVVLSSDFPIYVPFGSTRKH